MARRNRDDDLLLEEDELTAAFLGDDDAVPVTDEGQADPGAVGAMPTDEWDDEEAVLPGQLAVDVYETREKLVVKARTAGVNQEVAPSMAPRIAPSTIPNRTLFISNSSVGGDSLPV